MLLVMIRYDFANTLVDMELIFLQILYDSRRVKIILILKW